MPQLKTIQLDFGRAETELGGFKQFLRDHATFSESQVVAELKKREHLSCLIGSMIAGVPRADVFKFEFQIQGVFRADLVVGNLQQKRFMLVEFESGGPNSLFGKGGTGQMRDWSKEIGHGFGQLVDWSWAMDDAHNTQIFKNGFGCDDISAEYLLVCGRDALMVDPTEAKRFFWRRDKVTIGGKNATCLTYDGLSSFFQTTIEAIKSYSHPL